MADDTDPPPPVEAKPPPTILEAELAGGPSGGVLRGAELDFAAAVARRRVGSNVVVCGADADANRRLAEQIESAVGPCVRGDPHSLAGPHALPHYQPDPRPPNGHTFYETTRRKSRKRK
jgi:hypothetical protein